MVIILTGGTGLIGQSLGQKLVEANHSIHLISRSEKSTQNINYPFKLFLWPTDSDQFPLEAFPQNSPFGIIHLAGAPILNWPWTKKKKESIYNSRVLRTKALVQACNNLTSPPDFFISANAIGIYGEQGNNKVTETSSFEDQNLFLQKVCKDWQKEVEKINPKCRTVIFRNGIVLDREKGFLKTQIQWSQLFVPFFLSKNPLWMSWIHKKDIVSLFCWAVKTATVQGVYNATAEHPVSINHFLNQLAIYLNRKYLRSPVPLSLIKILGGEMMKNLLCSCQALPQKAKQEGFTFKYKTLEEALIDLLLK